MSNPWDQGPTDDWRRRASETRGGTPPTVPRPHGAAPPYGYGNPPAPRPPERPRQSVLKHGWTWVLGHKVWSGIGVLVTVIVFAISTAITMSQSPSPGTNTTDRCSASGTNISINCSGNPTSATPQQAGLTPVNSKPDPNSSLQLTTVWPWVSGCPSIGSAVAMPVGGGSIQDFHSPRDLTPTFIENGAGSWIQGSMYLHLQASSGQRLEIIDIKPHIQRRDLAPPAWVYIEKSGCGPSPGDRRFVLNLDQPLLTDRGVEQGPLRKADAPTADLGTGFTVDDHHDTQIRLDTLSCHGNYQWTLEIRYTVTGTSGVQSAEIGPMTSYGRADNTIRYVGNQGPSGVVNVTDQQTITGGDPSYFRDECRA
jgi:hypothetical protein